MYKSFHKTNGDVKKDATMKIKVVHAPPSLMDSRCALLTFRINSGISERDWPTVSTTPVGFH